MDMMENGIDQNAKKKAQSVCPLRNDPNDALTNRLDMAACGFFTIRLLLHIGSYEILPSLPFI